MSRSETLVE